MKKIILLGVLMFALFLIACAPELSEEELEAQLGDLEPEELDAVLSEDESALAGQAAGSKIRTLRRYYKPTVTKYLSCYDSDGGEKIEVFGTATMKYSQNGVLKESSLDDECYTSPSGEAMLRERFCNGNLFATAKYTCDNGCKNGACLPAPAVCGNGLIEGTETCDDGCMQGVPNVCEMIDNDDGCSAQCTLELCGNGVVDLGETCDDGNTAEDDGCDVDCNVYELWSCSGEPSVCVSSCGNGVVDSGEQCDDGNTINGDGCSAFCKTQICTPLEKTCSSATLRHWCNLYGDGYLDVDCSAQGKICVNGECFFANICGNELVEGTEDCDTPDLNMQTCGSQGFNSGTLGCNVTCGFNTTLCN